jgi:hypothetical protein
MTNRRRLVKATCVLAVALLAAGCGPKEVRGAKLKGQLVKDGQPVAPQRGERYISIIFERVEPVDKQLVRSGGRVQSDGTFAVEGQMANGTPPGTYEVRIHAEVSGDKESRFAPLFADGKTPFIADVTDQQDQFFVIDVGTKTITKK